MFPLGERSVMSVVLTVPVWHCHHRNGWWQLSCHTEGTLMDTQGRSLRGSCSHETPSLLVGGRPVSSFPDMHRQDLKGSASQRRELPAFGFNQACIRIPTPKPELVEHRFLGLIPRVSASVSLSSQRALNGREGWQTLSFQVMWSLEKGLKNLGDYYIITEKKKKPTSLKEPPHFP